jgi:hypothetical protein
MKATRAVCCPITDTHYMEGPVLVLGRRLSVGGLGRVGDVDPLGSNVDEDVLATVALFELCPMPLINLAASPGDVTRIEAHRLNLPRPPASWSRGLADGGVCQREDESTADGSRGAILAAP